MEEEMVEKMVRCLFREVFKQKDSLQTRASSPIIASSLFPKESKIPSPSGRGLEPAPDVIRG